MALRADESEAEIHKEAGSSAAPVDVRVLMADIRARVKSEIERHGTSRTPYKPHAADQNAQASRKAGELLHSEELRYLNSNYAYSAALNIDGLKSHRPGVLGRLVVACKRKLMRIIFDSILKDYFSAEREFNSNVVRFLNDVSKYVDARDASNFWELIRKIDVDIAKALERIERLTDEQGASLVSTERRVFEELYRSVGELAQRLTALQGSSEQHSAALKSLDSVARGLEGALARAGREIPQDASASTGAKSTPTKIPESSYLLLENRFRGSEAEISRRLEIYPPLFKAAEGPVLEIGPGRGELQLLFGAAGISSYGIDVDAAMVQAAQACGVNSKLGDGIEHLRRLEARSLGGVIAIQVVEHLTRAQLEELMQLCAAKVKRGGRIIFETINPQSVTALSSNYFRDPTHVWPLHPDTLSYQMTLANLDVKEVRMLSPVPAEAQLRSLPMHEYMTPRWMETVTLFNHNIEQLNKLLYGYQDYCLVAEAR